MNNEVLNNELERLTADVLASYETDRRTCRIGEAFLPSRTRIVEILEEIRQLLFPGFFGHQMLTRQNVKFHVGSLMERIGRGLTEQITHCLCSQSRMSRAGIEEGPSARRHGAARPDHAPGRRVASKTFAAEADDVCDGCKDLETCHKEAMRIARDFLARVPAVRQRLALDVQAAYDGDPAAKSIDEVIYCYPGFYAVTVYRVAHELLLLGVPLMARIMCEHAHSATGTDIHPGATIGESFFIDHATGVVIGETTRIGDHVKIYQGVTLGAKSFPKDERGRIIKGLQRHPTIEDHVTIYANATILGGQTVIGKGVTVSGNTFITDSVTADSVVEHKAPELHVRAKKKAAT
jgi:serine O-acetyltransferase